MGVVYPTFCQLADVYSQVIDAHNFTWIDFLLEGSSLTNTASIDVRNQALVSLKAKYPRLRISYTLPSQLNGLSPTALNVLQSSVKFKLNVDVVNVLAMNYGATGVAGNMGNAAIQTAIAVYNQVRTLKMNSGIGITPMVSLFLFTKGTKSSPSTTRVSLRVLPREPAGFERYPSGA